MSTEPTGKQVDRAVIRALGFDPDTHRIQFVRHPVHGIRIVDERGRAQRFVKKSALNAMAVQVAAELEADQAEAADAATKTARRRRVAGAVAGAATAATVAAALAVLVP
jgi:hypothetical protein